MSLTREAMAECKDYLRGLRLQPAFFLASATLRVAENCANLFGQKFFECRLVAACQLATKGDKFETRFLIVSKFRLFIVVSELDFSSLKKKTQR